MRDIFDSLGRTQISSSHRFGPRWAWFGKFTQLVWRPIYRAGLRWWNVHTIDSGYAQAQLERCREKLARGETVWVIGIGAAGHNTGISLLEISPHEGMKLHCNDEEERYTGVKHCMEYPVNCLGVLKQRLTRLNLTPKDIDAFLVTWDYGELGSLGFRVIAEELPRSWRLLIPASCPNWLFFKNLFGVASSPKKLARDLDLGKSQPIIQMPHHENHAAASYALSPFARSGERTVITVLDGFGDEGAMSLFVAEDGRLEKLKANYSIADSLGAFYTIISSTQGGWSSFSSEGRYMGAVAWGNGDRLTNPYYKRLRELFHFGDDGEILVNRSMANWHLTGELTPYRQPLKDVLGEPIPPEQLWNPDAVLRVEDVNHSEISRERVDKAAATQMVFEDAVFHIVDNLIRTTRCTRLVMSGGTALNCLVNMNLVAHYDREWFQRNLGMDDYLKLWVPPIPGDAGVPIGAAYNFGLRMGAKIGPALQDAFLCGLPPSQDDIESALQVADDIEVISIDNNPRASITELADLIACIIDQQGVLGMYQGSAETGPRALGHRSIIANATRSDTLKLINSRVKFREPIRPLAPMVTLEAAHDLFEISEGVSADEYNGYNYMVLTVKAKPKAQELVPAVVHFDGTARIQIVREKTDPLTHAILKALGRRTGAEVMVNTSLNVGSPIVQTPAQAFTALRRAKALSGIVMLSESGEHRIAYHNVDDAPKDAGRQLKAWVADWQSSRT